MAATSPSGAQSEKQTIIRELAEDLRAAAAEGAAFEAACIAGMLVGMGVKVNVRGESEALWAAARDEAQRLEVNWLERLPAAIRLGPEIQLSLLIDMDELLAGFAWLGAMPPAVRAELDMVTLTIKEHSAAFSAVRRVAQQHVAAYREAGFRSPAVALWSAVLEGGATTAEG